MVKSIKPSFSIKPSPKRISLPKRSHTTKAPKSINAKLTEPYFSSRPRPSSTNVELNNYATKNNSKSSINLQMPIRKGSPIMISSDRSFVNSQPIKSITINSLNEPSNVSRNEVSDETQSALNRIIKNAIGNNHNNHNNYSNTSKLVNPFESKKKTLPRLMQRRDSVEDTKASVETDVDDDENLSNTANSSNLFV